VAKHDALIAVGADHVVDVTAPDPLAQIRSLTSGRGVDKAVEFTGAETMMRLCIDALRLGGTFCPVGGEGAMLPLRVADLVAKELNVHGVRASTRHNQHTVVELLARGKLKVPIHATLPLSRIADAHRMMEAADLVGRIVLHPW
jgi:NADPH:quinone reductase-like Zn-dependent oxidoreductase